MSDKFLEGQYIIQQRDDEVIIFLYSEIFFLVNLGMYLEAFEVELP